MKKLIIATYFLTGLAFCTAAQKIPKANTETAIKKFKVSQAKNKSNDTAVITAKPHKHILKKRNKADRD